MLLRLQMQTGLALYTLDVKDAFLLMDQPADEKAMIVTSNGKYKLKKNLPGQRNAAAQWFKGFFWCSGQELWHGSGRDAADYDEERQESQR